MQASFQIKGGETTLEGDFKELDDPRVMESIEKVGSGKTFIILCEHCDDWNLYPDEIRQRNKVKKTNLIRVSCCWCKEMMDVEEAVSCGDVKSVSEMLNELLVSDEWEDV